MATEVSICNMALASLGNSNSIASLTETSIQAKQCNAHYAQCRDEMLQAYPWGFASKRVLLSLVDEELVTNWGYCYSYPSDALRVFSLVTPGIRNPKLTEAIPFEVATYGANTVILTDQADAEAFYAFRVTDPTKFTPLAIKALFKLLAARISRPITGNEVSEEGFIRAVSEAAQADTGENNPGVEPDCDYITGRE